jgi:hypothetical protein
VFWKKKAVGGVVFHGNTGDVADRYNAGVGFLQAGNIDKAIEVFSELAKTNHTSAMYNLALLYTQGHGERLMHPEAQYLMHRAAVLGHEGAATHYAVYTQFQGFDPENGSGLSDCLNMIGDGAVPLILINAISIDLLSRMGSGANAYLYVIKELGILLNASDKTLDFIEAIGFKPSNHSESLRQEDDPPASLPLRCQERMASIMDDCVRNRGMSRETALFIRCSVVGILAKTHGISPPRHLPPIEFYT